MKSVSAISYARAGLLGNPSDGYGGKAVAFTFREFMAQVFIEPASHVEILSQPHESATCAGSLDELVQRWQSFGYYGGTRLIQASLQKFHEWCDGRFELHKKNFSIRYQTNIPRSVGLAGSSAIVTATLKALGRYFQVEIRPAVLATLALQTEKELLGIPAGLMDRMAQSTRGVSLVDCSPQSQSTCDGIPVGRYRCLEEGRAAVQLSEHLYVAWASRAAEPTEVLHSDLGKRFAQGDSTILQAIQRLAEIAESGAEAWESGDGKKLDELIDENFDIRSSICSLPTLHQQMVRLARQAGGSAKFCGSGGAIVGFAPSQSIFDNIQNSLNALGCQTIRPQIVWTSDDS